MDNYSALKAATLGASNIQPAPSPLGSFPELDKLNSLSFQLPQSNEAAGALSNTASQQVAQQDAEAKAAAAAQKDALDPSKYKQVAKADGGYAFFDPNGQEISAADYAHITNKDLGTLLKNSSNPIDQGFTKDWADLQHYGNLKLQSQKDTAAAAKAKAIEDEVQKRTGVDLHNANIGDVMNVFMKAYPTVFAQGGFKGAGTAGIPSGQTFIPEATNSFVDNAGTSTGGGIAT